jgi:hypothetical protein
VLNSSTYLFETDLSLGGVTYTLSIDPGLTSLAEAGWTRQKLA